MQLGFLRLIEVFHPKTFNFQLETMIYSQETKLLSTECSDECEIFIEGMKEDGEDLQAQKMGNRTLLQVFCIFK